MKILAATSDLFLQSRIIEVAKKFGSTAKFVSTGEELVREASPTEANLVILDLDATEYDPFSRVPQLKKASPSLKILALYPHVKDHLRLRANALGIDHVVPNSKFLKTLASILEKETQTL